MKKRIRDVSSKKTKQKRRRILIIIVTIILTLLIIRIFLPSLVLKYVNKQLTQLKGYTGNVKDIDIYLYRGAYKIIDISLYKIKNPDKSNYDTVPILKSPEIDLSVEWSALLKGSVRGKILFTESVVNFTNTKSNDSESEKNSKKSTKEEIREDTSDFRNLIKSLMPLTINRFEVRKGQIHYIDLNAQPAVDISMTEIYLTAINLTNIEDKNAPLPSKLNMESVTYGGRFTLDLKFDPLKKNPTFELKTELKNMNLTDLNAIFKAYGNISVAKGKFSLYGEFAGKEGEFGGYIKPFITGFEVKKWKEDQELKQRLWELVVGTAMKILENPKTNQVASKIPINGSFNNSEINIWQAIHYVLRNAFVQALRPTIENSINLNQMQDETKKTTLEKIFGNEKKDKEKGKKNKEKETGKKKDKENKKDEKNKSTSEPADKQ